MRSRGDLAWAMAHENEDVLLIHVQEDTSLEGGRMEKVPEGKERWSADSVLSREGLEMEHARKGVGSPHMERQL